jgi:hypothetical protein
MDKYEEEFWAYLEKQEKDATCTVCGKLSRRVLCGLGCPRCYDRWLHSLSS